MNSGIVYGIQAVKAALKSDQPVEKILLSNRDKSKSRFQLIVKDAKQRNIPIHFVPPENLTKKTGNTKHQGILAYCSEKSFLDLEELLLICKNVKEPPLLVMIDGIEDPHNLGAIIRSAEAAGISGMIIPERRIAPFSGVVSKTSAGASNYLPVARVKNLSRSIERLKQENFWIVGSDENTKQNFWQIPAQRPLVVIIGSEGKGVHRLIKEKCDYMVRIPMYGKTESLNASVAAALLFYEIRRQRVLE